MDPNELAKIERAVAWMREKGVTELRHKFTQIKLGDEPKVPIDSPEKSSLSAEEKRQLEREKQHQILFAASSLRPRMK